MPWALLYDAAGDDRYWSDGAAQGVIGADHYHFDAGKPVYSHAALHDAGGRNRYSSEPRGGEADAAGASPVAP